MTAIMKAATDTPNTRRSRNPRPIPARVQCGKHAKGDQSGA